MRLANIPRAGMVYNVTKQKSRHHGDKEHENDGLLLLPDTRQHFRPLLLAESLEHTRTYMPAGIRVHLPEPQGSLEPLEFVAPPERPR